MKKFKILTVGAIALALTVAGCSKDPKNPHDEHNHDDPAIVTFTFTRGHYHGSSFHAGKKTVVAVRHDGKFIDPETNKLIGDGSKSPVVTLDDGELQKLTIAFYDGKGNSLNKEFLEEANIHQFFFIPSKDGVLDYVYKDENNARVGFDGDFTVKQVNQELDLEIVLRHGINKSSQREWNDRNYGKYGGSDDFKKIIRIKTVKGEAHHHH